MWGDEVKGGCVVVASREVTYNTDYISPPQHNCTLDTITLHCPLPFTLDEVVTRYSWGYPGLPFPDIKQTTTSKVFFIIIESQSFSKRNICSGRCIDLVKFAWAVGDRATLAPRVIEA
jgi:hypothetical protein